METQIARGSYFAGLTLAALAAVWRAAAVVGMTDPLQIGSAGVGVTTLYKAALILLVLSIASALNSTKR